MYMCIHELIYTYFYYVGFETMLSALGDHVQLMLTYCSKVHVCMTTAKLPLLPCWVRRDLQEAGSV